MSPRDWHIPGQEIGVPPLGGRPSKGGERITLRLGEEAAAELRRLATVSGATPATLAAEMLTRLLAIAAEAGAPRSDVGQKDSKARLDVMSTYPIADSAGYHGAGYALAAIRDGRAIALRYVEDLAPELSEVEPSAVDVEALGAHPGLHSAAHELEAIGECVFGMASSWEFLEL